MKKYLILGVVAAILMTAKSPVIGSLIAGLLLGALIQKMTV